MVPQTGLEPNIAYILEDTGQICEHIPLNYWILFFCRNSSDSSSPLGLCEFIIPDLYPTRTNETSLLGLLNKNFAMV